MDVALIVVTDDGQAVIEYADVGALFITKVDGAIIVEAVAIAEPGEPRKVVRKRHAELKRRARELFGEFTHHDPLGLCGGPKEIAS